VARFTPQRNAAHQQPNHTHTCTLSPATSHTHMDAHQHTHTHIHARRVRTDARPTPTMNGLAQPNYIQRPKRTIGSHAFHVSHIDLSALGQQPNVKASGCKFDGEGYALSLQERKKAVIFRIYTSQITRLAMRIWKIVVRCDTKLFVRRRWSAG